MKVRGWIFIFLLYTLIILHPVEALASSFERELVDDWAFYNSELISQEAEASGEPRIVKLPVEFDDLNGKVYGYGRVGTGR